MKQIKIILFSLIVSLITSCSSIQPTRYLCTVDYKVYYGDREVLKQDTVILLDKFKPTLKQYSVSGSNYIDINNKRIYASTAPYEIISWNVIPILKTSIDSDKAFPVEINYAYKKKIIYISNTPLEPHEVTSYRKKYKFIIGETKEGKYVAIFPYSNTKKIVNFYQPINDNEI